MPNAPGWYRDPTGLPFDRYWNGIAWTDKTYTPPPSRESPTNYSNLPVPAPPVATSRPWYQHKGIVITAAIAAVLVVLGALGAEFGPTKKIASHGPGQLGATTIPTATATTDATQSVTSHSTGSTRPPAHGTASATQLKSTGSKNTAAADGSFVMPDEIGGVLQHVQDDIQRVSADPVFRSHSHDVLGTRFQVRDRDWKVCTQNVRAGRRVSAVGHLDFGVVKLDETCP